MIMEMSTNTLTEGNIPVVVFLGILMLVGLLGNSVVCYVYICKLTSSTINLFIIALAVSDLINCTVNVPLESAALYYRFAFTSHYWVCVVLRTSVPLMASASSFLLLAIAVERYNKICRSLKHQITKATANIVITICCILAILQALPPFVLYGKRELPQEQVNSTLYGEPACAAADKYTGTPFHTIYSGLQVFIFVGLTTTLFVLYFLIWRRVMKQEKTRRGLDVYKRDPFKSDEVELQITYSTPEDSQSSKNEQAEAQASRKCEADRVDHDTEKNPTDSPSTAVKKMTCMLFVITLAFILSFLPCIGVSALVVVNKRFLKDATVVEYVIYHILSRSFFLQSVSNPVIYTIYNKQFRQHVKRLMKRKTRYPADL